MAIEQITGMSHLGHQPSRPPGATPRQMDDSAWRMSTDQYQPTRTPAHQGHEDAARPTTDRGGSRLSGLANLGRLQHGLHLLAPVGNLAKGAGQLAQAAPGPLDVAQLTGHASHEVGASQVVAHAHHGLEMATAAKGGFIARMGGPLSTIATGLSAVVAVLDIKRAIGVFKDPAASTRDKAWSTTQAILSGASGAAGVLAAAGALGVALPFAIPALLTFSTITGLASFVVSLLNRKQGHAGH